MPYEEAFRKVGREEGVDYCLLYEIARRESNFNPLAIGSVGEYGLMQVHPDNWNTLAPKLGLYDPFDPYSNIKVAAVYLKWLVSEVKSMGLAEERWILVGYNWGTGNLKKLIQSGGGWDRVPQAPAAYATSIILSAEACRISGEAN